MVDVACAFLKGRQHLVQIFWGSLPAIGSICQPPTLSVWGTSAKGNRVTILSTTRRKLLCYSPTGLPGEGAAPFSETQAFPIPLVLCEEKQDRPHFQKPHFSSTSIASVWSCWVLLAQADGMASIMMGAPASVETASGRRRPAAIVSGAFWQAGALWIAVQPSEPAARVFPSARHFVTVLNLRFHVLCNGSFWLIPEHLSL